MRLRWGLSERSPGGPKYRAPYGANNGVASFFAEVRRKAPAQQVLQQLAPQIQIDTPASQRVFENWQPVRSLIWVLLTLHCLKQV